MVLGLCDPMSALSHLAAAALACVAGFRLIRLSKRNPRRTAALVVYAVCVVGLLSVSGVYHSLPSGPARAFMRHVDYLAIWFLIAGTFTAVHGVMCRGFWRCWMLTFIWLYVAAAVTLQLLWFKHLSGTLGLLLYLVLGWIGLVTVVKIGRQIGFRAARPLWFAGIVFSVGAILEALRQPLVIECWLGPREVFHFAVIAGAAVHWLFIRKLVLVYAPEA
jgi:hemolysin III